MTTGPRIYNLFPLLGGSYAQWEQHLPRIAKMGFEWVYVNAIHQTGGSGSLYAVRDHFNLNPLFRGKGQKSDVELFRRFVNRARNLGLRVMVDLVATHVSKDSRMVAEHPGWFVYAPDGTLRSPSVVDPADASRVTTWHDLAVINYGTPDLQGAIVEYWTHVLRFLIDLGVLGFRGETAYQVPVEVWRQVIAFARQYKPEAVFLADTLGCRMDQVEPLRSAGFEYLYNSSKWWDFQADWLLDQYEFFRHLAPTVGFPESCTTTRLAADLAQAGVTDARMVAARCRQAYAFAALFSTGISMPIGFEHGFKTRLDNTTTRPDLWEAPAFDISDYITEVNRLKALLPVLNEEGPQERLFIPRNPAVALLRRTDSREAGVLTLLNPTGQIIPKLDPRELLVNHGLDVVEFTEVTPGVRPDEVLGSDLEPFGIRVFKVKVQPAEHDLDVTRHFVIIEAVEPQLDGGRYPIKREVGDWLRVFADIYSEGHDVISAVLKFRHKGDVAWRETAMKELVNDQWTAKFHLAVNGRYEYTIEAWTNRFESWRKDMVKKVEAENDVSLELIEGRHLLTEIMEHAAPAEYGIIEQTLHKFDGGEHAERLALMLSGSLREAVARIPDRPDATQYDPVLEVTVDRPIARYAAWYEMFHRSQGTEPGKSATFEDCIRRLPEIRSLGFNVIYFVPIHPIGRSYRKGKNNSLTCMPGEPGSPYAIGSSEGGHKAVHPDLGTLEDFRHFVNTARGYGMEVALDFAIQCSPDHPWVKEHPEWFVFRPDGTIKYAENPPKKYQDIVNVNFYGGHRAELWNELRDIVQFWIDQGVTIFRVDNPHTKPVRFWEWLIGDIQSRHPETIFLSEAFTRPKMMKMLAKVGFTQSYTYFTWRNFKHEIIDYMEELASPECAGFMRPSFFPTTPDILPKGLQIGGRPAFMMRFALAALMSSVYGMYNGYELCEGRGLPGKEEYADSEKYEHKVWDWNRHGNIKDFIANINRIRRENPALWEFENIDFLKASNDNILFFSKMTPNRDNAVMVAINVNPFETHESAIEVPIWELGIPENASYEVEELQSRVKFRWAGRNQKVRLEPHVNPVAIFRIQSWQIKNPEAQYES